MIAIRECSLKTKLLASLVLSGVLSIAIIAWQGYQTGKSALEASSFDQLISIREMKARQIEVYFEHVSNQVLTFSNDLTVIDAMKEFKAAFHDLIDDHEISEQQLANYEQEVRRYYQDGFLKRLQSNLETKVSIDTYWPKDDKSTYFQYQYIANNPNDLDSKEYLDMAEDDSEYSAVHAKFHPVLRDYMKTFGYFDIYLVDSEGDIVYSVCKAVDYATNLLTGPYRDSNFGRVFEEALDDAENDFVMIVDFEPYDPAYAAPVSFIGSPILDNDEIIGVLLFQMPADEISGIMTGDQDWAVGGMGDTGQTYLVGSDFKMRSEARGLIEDKEEYLEALKEVGTDQETIDKIDKYGTTLLLQTMRTPASEDALRGNSNAALVEDFRGVPVLSAYTQLDLDDVNWVLISEIEASEAFAPIMNLARKILIWGAAIILVVIGYALLFTASITRPLIRMTEVAANIAIGDLDQTLDYRARTASRIPLAPIGRLVSRLKRWTGSSGTSSDQSFKPVERKASRNEVTKLANAFTRMIEAQKAKAEIVEQIALGNLDVAVKVVSDKDVLGKAIVTIENALRNKAEAAIQIAEGNLEANVEVASDHDLLGNAMVTMVRKLRKSREDADSAMVLVEANLNEAKVVVDEVNRVAELLKCGELNQRANAASALGAYKQMLGGFNNAIDNILAPVQEGVEVLQKMAQGNLSLRVKGKYEGEHAAMKQAVNNTLGALNEILGQVNVTVAQIANRSVQFAKSAQLLSDGGAKQSASLEQISASMNDIGAQTKRNAENAVQVNELSAAARDTATVGNEQMKKMLSAMADIKNSSDAIKQIIKTIDEIAFQTNLLSLNAAVEAARAGVHGKGFAVVAEEVRNLAQRSAKAARETTEMIEDSAGKVENGMKLAQGTAEDLEKIVQSIGQVTDLVGEIAEASRDQAQGTEHVNAGLKQVEEVTYANTENAKETAEAVQALSGQGFQLKGMLSKFELNQNRPAMQQKPSPASRKSSSRDAVRVIDDPT